MKKSVVCIFSFLVIARMTLFPTTVSDALRSVDELPIDRFDEYQPDSLPPHPWLRLGNPAANVEIALKAEGESPFCGNKLTGKGLVMHDASDTSGAGTGIFCRFTPPPDGPVYLGFDFRYNSQENGDGVNFVCRLDNGSDNLGLSLHLGESNRFSIIGSDGTKAALIVIAPDKWYHVGATIIDDEVTVLLVDATQCRFDPNQVSYIKTPFTGKAKFKKADSYTRLIFFSAGANEKTGGWMLDNISMGGKVDAPRDAWLPFKRESTATLRQSDRKVYAYYYIYGSAYDDKDPGLAWYTRTLLNPSLLTKSDRKNAGTELLYRPLMRPPMQPGMDEKEVRLRSFEEEIRLAIQQGIDGFVADFHSYPQGSTAYFTGKSFAMMDAAQRFDPGFKIIPAVYSSGDNGPGKEGNSNQDPVKYANSPVIKRIAEHPAALRTADGRLVFSMWLTESRSAEWWMDVIKEMKKNGTPIALVAQFNGWNKIVGFSNVCYGMSQWGPRSPKDFNYFDKWVATARTLTGKTIFPIVEQDVRTRGCWVQESENSSLLIRAWEQAIVDNADWAFMNTWSDYTEQAMAPSTFIGFAPYDINAYYTQWFKTGTQPKMTQDVLYYFYRRNHSDVDPGKGSKWSFRPYPAKDEIELLAFLTAPGTLSILVDGQIFEKEASAGIVSFKVPLPKDKTFVPEFSLRRNGNKVVSRKGHYTVLGKVEYPHMIYSSGVIASGSME